MNKVRKVMQVCFKIKEGNLIENEELLIEEFRPNSFERKGLNDQNIDSVIEEYQEMGYKVNNRKYIRYNDSRIEKLLDKVYKLFVDFEKFNSLEEDNRFLSVPSIWIIEGKTEDEDGAKEMIMLGEYDVRWVCESLIFPTKSFVEGFEKMLKASKSIKSSIGFCCEKENSDGVYSYDPSLVTEERVISQMKENMENAFYRMDLSQTKESVNKGSFYQIKLSYTPYEVAYTTSSGMCYGWKKYLDVYVFFIQHNLDVGFYACSSLLRSALKNGFITESNKQH